jgi:HEAT repeat protein
MIEKIIIRSEDAYLLKSEISEINALDEIDISKSLIKLVRESASPSHRSRAFHALMILENFDQLNFLLDFYTTAPPGFDHVCLQSLEIFNHPRSIGRLCDVLLNSQEVELRFTAAEVLEKIADPTSLFALEYAMKNDLVDCHTFFIW